MEKRLVLAIALSLVIMLSWSALFTKTQPIDNKQVMQPQGPSSHATLFVPAAVLVQDKPEVARELITFKQESREYIFDVAKAAIVEVVFKVNREHRLPLRVGFYGEDSDLFKLEKISKDAISFIYQDQNKRVIKNFSFANNNYTIDLEIKTFNLSSSPLVLTSHLVLGKLDLSVKNPQSRYQGVFLGGKEKNLHLGAGKEFSSQDIKFIGLRDQYFCAIVEPVARESIGYVKKINPQESEVGLLAKEIIVNPEAQIGQLYRIYLGPQDLKTINSIKQNGQRLFIMALSILLRSCFYNY